MVRKWLMVLTAVFMLLTSTACAEELNRDALLDASTTVVEWQVFGEEATAQLQDEDAVIMMEVMNNTLTVISSALMDAAQVENDFTGKMGELRGQLPYVDAVSGNYGSGTRWIDELSAYCDVQVSCENNYLCAELTMYDTEGTLLGLQRVEYGRQGEQFMALLVDYDQIQWMTGRFALYPEGISGRMIYTKTLGQTLDVVLDMRSWTQGEEIAEWNKYLLLPANVLDSLD